MNIIEIKNCKRNYMNLLLLADEQEDMIERYLNRGTMYALDDQGIKAICVVCDEGNGILEIKNIATDPNNQHKGYGRTMISFIENHYKGTYHILQVGTGDGPLTIRFYEKCGFKRSHIVKNFFVDNYNHPIFEAEQQLIDMVYLRKTI